MMGMQDKETLNVRVLDANQGGLLCRVFSLQAFIPISQLAKDRETWLSLEVRPQHPYIALLPLLPHETWLSLEVCPKCSRIASLPVLLGSVSFHTHTL